MRSSSEWPAWPGVPPQHGRVLLRAFEPDDVAMVLDLASDPYVPSIGTLPTHAGRAEGLAWIDRQRRRLADGVGFSFAVADTTSGAALGFAGLWLTGWTDGRASVGYAVAPRARGAGVGADALSAVVRFAWSVPELWRLEAYIEPWNVASVRTAERAGFEREGLLRSHQPIGGTRRDMLLYAAIRAR